jgi:peptide/nickel transport system substrate-binding protein
MIWLGLMVVLTPGHVAAQGGVVCESDAVVQAEDSLSILSEKFYGNVLAFPVIADATNEAAASDDSYATIDDPNVIELGWKLCIPGSEVAQAMLNETVFTQVAAGETTLVVGITEDAIMLDPVGAFDFYSSSVHNGIYETLTAFPPGRVDEIVPGVAESWEISDDGLTYTFTIAPGHTFSTGRPVTAADAAFTLNRIRHYKGNPAFLLDNLDTIEAVDENTLVITQKEPDPSLLAKMAFTSFGIIDAEEARAHGATDAEDAAETDTAEQWLNQNSLGSGPYMLQKWEPKVETILVRNPEYSSGPPADIDRVIFRTLSEAATQKLALEAGDVDIALDITADQVPSLKESPNIEVFEGLTPTVFFLITNADPSIGGPLSEDAVQDAIRLAIDYEGMKILAGGAATTPVNIMPVHWAYALDPSNAPQRDVEAAKARLAEGGYPDGLTVDLEYPIFTSGGIAVETLAQKVQADLAEAGITVNLKPADIGPSLERYRQGESPFGLWFWGPDILDPADRLSFTPGGKVGLRVNWDESNSSPELNEAVGRAKLATDPAERERAFTDIQTIMLEESPFAFLVQTGIQAAYNNRVQNFVYTGSTNGRVAPYVYSIE